MNLNQIKSKYLTNTRVHKLIQKNRKYNQVVFFSLGFTWDWITLERVDKLSDVIILSSYMAFLSICVFVYNAGENLKFGNKIIKRYLSFFPLAIQFFLGGLTSAYVIYFSKSVSLSKSMSFFIIIILLLVANEIFKKRMSNIYFQFAFYTFVSFTFFAYMIPVLISIMNPLVFTISGIISFGLTYSIIFSIYKINTSLKSRTNKRKLLLVVISVYGFMASFYYFNLIPPVPLALNKSLVAYNIKKEADSYKIEYLDNPWYVFWRDHKYDILIDDEQKIYVFSSIFAPTDLNKKVYHVWKKYNAMTEDYKVTDKIGFEITGGRNGGFRGYTFKKNVVEGKWQVDVITEEGLIIGVIDFNLVKDNTANPNNTKTIIL